MTRFLWLFAACVSTAAWAKPPAPQAFCAKYPTAPACVGTVPACTYCHGSPPTRNAYGTAVEMALVPQAPRPLSDGDFTTALPGALSAAEALDSDGDGVSNLVEIQKGTLPGDVHSKPADGTCASGENPNYALCRYDFRLVFRKVSLDFCGVSPTYEALQTFLAKSDAEKPQAIATLLDGCLGSEFWKGKNGQLWELAHKKVRPVGSLKRGEDQGAIPLADYYDDYALYAWAQLDDHDLREVLTATDFAARSVNNGVTSYAKVASRPVQLVPLARRAGNLSSAWNLVYNVMFTALPRNAASQAYRGYLGLDIAKQEGLYAVAGEPKDYDGKGVQQALCAQCHATLDPLSYPFRNYNGLSGNQFATYVNNRIETLFANEAPNITQIPERGSLLGQPVNDLKQWGQVAANSDQFAMASVNEYWRLLVGDAPSAEQHAEFTALWKKLKGEHAYSVRKMLHDLVKTEAYGVP